MRFVAILFVVAIIGFAYSRRANQPSSTDKAMAEFNETVATPAVVQKTPATPIPVEPGSGMRRPIDTTRKVLDQVKDRNGGF